jgi:3-oxoacyl-[acyl-carrier-protein] synthase II
MKAFINGMGNISPQKNWGTLLIDPIGYDANHLACVEPDYVQWIDPRQLRRMSRIIKMGVASASMALKDAGVEKPNGIITGTGYGCLDDTGIFLTKMIDNNEEALNPTPFIQSTHNTIAGQIALLLQCQAYNQTYAHTSFSFESSLMDAMLQLIDEPGNQLLVGGIDEITAISHQIQSRLGMFRREPVFSLDLFKTAQKGTLNGEGASYFVLSGTQNEKSIANIESVTTFYKPEPTELKKGIINFLADAKLKPEDIDLVLVGKSGDQRVDHAVDAISSSFFATNSVGLFKHLCGEYPTASAFALWLGAKILHENKIPVSVAKTSTRKQIKFVLIYNPYLGSHHSLILLRSCRDII